TSLRERRGGGGRSSPGGGAGGSPAPAGPGGGGGAGERGGRRERRGVGRAPPPAGTVPGPPRGAPAARPPPATPPASAEGGRGAGCDRVEGRALAPRREESRPRRGGDPVLRGVEAAQAIRHHADDQVDLGPLRVRATASLQHEVAVALEEQAHGRFARPLEHP